jgi:hypothetical protein
MNRWWSFAVVIVLALVVGSAGSADEKQKTRNPFNVEDVPDPDGKDVKEFAEKVKLPGDARDPNAAQWAKKATAGKADSLEGQWSSRWNGGSAGNDWKSGTAEVKPVGNRVYILYKDDTGSYLIDARREGKTRLVGRYHSLDAPTDSSPWVGVILGAAAASGVYYLRASGQWPELGGALPLPPGNHLHPVALFGHGLTLALLVTLVLQWLRLRRRWAEAVDCDPAQSHWAGAAVRDCLDVLPARCTLKAYEKKLIERQERWTRTLDRRWLWFYCAALAVFVPGIVLVPLNLKPAPQPLPDPVSLFEPLAVAAVETVVVFLLALRVRLRWGDLLQTWVEAALDAQKKTARLRRKRPAESQAARWTQPSPPPPVVDLPDMPTLPTIIDPVSFRGNTTPMPPEMPSVRPTALGPFGGPPEPEDQTLGTLAASPGEDEVELIFDNDCYEDP